MPGTAPDAGGTEVNPNKQTKTSLQGAYSLVKMDLLTENN